MRHIISIFTMALAIMLGSGSLSAQTIGSASKGGDLIRAGESALAKGQFQAAQGHFAKALRSSDLTDAQVAKALYQRGVANERIDRPAQAIADITSALYLPSLAGADRAKAYLSRGRAYEAVGMNELARADISRAKNGGVSERQIARSSQPARSGSGGPTFATSSQSSGPSFDTQVQSSGSRTPAPKPKRQRVAAFETQTRAAPVKEEPIPSFRTTILPQDGSASSRNTRTASRTTTGAGSSWDTAANSQQAPAEKEKESESKVGRFFGKVWSKATGGDDDEKPPAPAEVPAPAATPQWNQTTNVARAPQPKPNWNAQVSSATRAPPAPVAAPGGAKGYRIQLAALRSDSEAQATWKRLQSKHKKFLGARQPNIVRTELGGLGTFYRVQLGPFADKASSQNLCKEFKSGGLDCFLLAP